MAKAFPRTLSGKRFGNDRKRSQSPVESARQAAVEGDRAAESRFREGGHGSLLRFRLQKRKQVGDLLFGEGIEELFGHHGYQRRKLPIDLVCL